MVVILTLQYGDAQWLLVPMIVILNKSATQFLDVNLITVINDDTAGIVRTDGQTED